MPALKLTVPVLESAPPEDPSDEATLKAVLERAIELSPKRLQAWYMRANISLRKADRLPQGGEKVSLYREGIADLEEYAHLVPHLAEVRFILATLYLSVNDLPAAKRWADEGLVLYKSNADVARRGLPYFIFVKDWTTAKRLLEDVVQEDSSDPDALYDLAKVRLLTGDRAGAIEIVEQLRLAAPGLVESDPVFLKALQSP